MQDGGNAGNRFEVKKLRGGRSRPSFPLLQQPLEFLHEFVQIPELAVDAGKSDVGNLVHLFQTLHQALADGGSREFLLRALLHQVLDLLDDILEGVHGDRPLFAGSQEAGHQLGPVEGLPPAILLDHHERNLVDPLVGGEAARARETFTAASHDMPLFPFPGVHHLVLGVSTERAFHDDTSSSRAAIRVTWPMVSPSFPTNSAPSATTGRTATPHWAQMAANPVSRPTRKKVSRHRSPEAW